MGFAPQQRALFRHLNVKKWSEPPVLCTFWLLNVKKWFELEVLCTFWLGNVLRATTACTFSTAQLPKVVRTWCVLYLLSWKCASRHNGVHFFISPLASWLEVTFRPLRSHKSLEKHSESRLPYLFAHLHLLSSDFLHLLASHFLTSPLWLFPPLLFHLCILSEVWLLNFLR